MCPAVPMTIDFCMAGSTSGLRLSELLFRVCSFPPPFAPAWSGLPAPFVPRARFAAPRAPFSLAHALEDLHEAQVDPAGLHVDADDLNVYLVAQPVHLLGVFPT